jgi:hypothetical protein
MAILGRSISISIGRDIFPPLWLFPNLSIFRLQLTLPDIPEPRLAVDLINRGLLLSGFGDRAIQSSQSPVPGPLPLLGVGAAFSCSRRLRRRTSLAHGSVSTATQTNDQV